MFTNQILFTIISLVIYQYLSVLVSQARYAHGVKAPATTGNQTFERYHRTHMNFLENLVPFIPLIWIAGLEFSQNFFYLAACIVWILGRSVFSYGYIKNVPGKLKLISSLTAVAASIVLGILSVMVAF
jgi:glutathione S-transferase